MGPKTQKKCAWAEMYQNDGLPWIYPALARRHTDGPLRAALLKTTVRCEGFAPGRSSSFFLLQELRPFVGPKTNPDTDTGTGPIPPVTVFRVKAYSGGVLARALPVGLRYLST